MTRASCSLCGGDIKPIAGLPTCQKCGHRPRAEHTFYGDPTKVQHSAPTNVGIGDGGGAWHQPVFDPDTEEQP